MKTKTIKKERWSIGFHLRLTKKQHEQLKKEAGMISLHRYILYKLFERGD